MHLWSDIKKAYFNREYLMVILITPVIFLKSLAFADLVQETKYTFYEYYNNFYTTYFLQVNTLQDIPKEAFYS